jgi:GR25 family glycosyltransferase involved in LPS biosynthesis
MHERGGMLLFIFSIFILFSHFEQFLVKALLQNQFLYIKAYSFHEKRSFFTKANKFHASILTAIKMSTEDVSIEPNSAQNKDIIRNRLQSKPILSKSLHSMVGYVISDFLAQLLISRRINFIRMIRMSFFGFFVHGPIGIYFIHFLIIYY